MKNIDLLAVNWSGQSALHLAARYLAASDLKLLIAELKKQNHLDRLINHPDQNGKTPIFYALEDGVKEAKEIITLLVNAGADLSVYDHQLKTPIFYTLRLLNSLEILKFLLRNGANPNQVTTSKRIYPIQVALHHNLDELTRTLLLHGADYHLDPESEEGSLLHTVAATGKTEFLNLLVAKGGSLSEPNGKGLQPIHVAAQRGKIETVRAIDAIDRAAIHAPIEQLEKNKIPLGVTALHLSLIRNQTETAEFLMKQGVSLENQAKEGVSAFSFAAAGASKGTLDLLSSHKISHNSKELLVALTNAISHDNLDVVILLYQRGIPFNIPLTHGMTGIQLASINNALLTTQYLLQNGADPFYIGPTGENALQLSATNDSCQQFSLMLDFIEPNLDEMLGNREMLMHTAAKRGKVNHMVCLIKKFASLDVRDSRGNTPLHLATQNQHSVAVDLLLACGASPLIKNDGGKLFHELVQPEDDATRAVVEKYQKVLSSSAKMEDTSLHLAVRSQNKLALLLAIYFGDLNAKNGEGQTALHVAAEIGDTEACMELVRGGADLEFQDVLLQTPLAVACKFGSSAVEFLINAGANPLAKDKSGFTVVQKVISSKLANKDELLRKIQK
jgi:ankyrin repeat protein